MIGIIEGDTRSVDYNSNNLFITHSITLILNPTQPP